jgi:hypothetical protein
MERGKIHTPASSVGSWLLRSPAWPASPSDSRLISLNMRRSITSEPGSIGNIAIRAASEGRRKRFRLIKRVVPPRPTSTNVQAQFPVLGPPGKRVSRLH